MFSEPRRHSAQTLGVRRPGVSALSKKIIAGTLHLVADQANARVPLSARELMILLWNGDPQRAQMAQDWRRVAENTDQFVRTLLSALTCFLGDTEMCPPTMV